MVKRSLQRAIALRRNKDLWEMSELLTGMLKNSESEKLINRLIIVD